jgi:aspartyl-tRNA(Asn)/glutamyl-tRNA(Gln) amidotransferase subunit A
MTSGPTCSASWRASISSSRRRSRCRRFEVGRPGVKEIAGREVGPLDWIPFTYPFNLTGQPAATVPVGFTASGLPVGLQIVGRRHGDRTVLAASAAFEAAAPWADSKPRLD